ncbi:MAG: nucleotidyltransferase substrate binding protein [Gammaproteobacteria bacterium]|nr:nucleotidyltransferase substrate binding protein [Gammaproteobacteria bacterium]MDD9852201.1 nucleotidyltransferase substrate binding protein [Gammaproteobacteria bacterium]
MNYDKLQKSLRHLELQYRNLESQGARAELNYLDREAIQESVIQRFEVCYDMMWKHIRRHLIDELGLPERDMPNSPKPVFRIAHQNHLLADIDAWLKHVQMRIDTSHDYSEEKMRNALRHMGGFIDEAVKVYETMTETTWQKSPS